MKHYQAGLCALVLSAAAFHAGAQQASVGHIDGYFIPNAELNNRDGDGFGVKGRASIAPQWFLTGEYQSVDYDNRAGELDQLRFGAGLISPLRQNVNFVGWLEYINLDGSRGVVDEDGFGAHIGMEAGLAPEFTAHASAGFVAVDDFDGPEFLFGLRYQATPQISIFGDYRVSRLSDRGVDVDLDDLRLGAGYHF